MKKKSMLVSAVILVCTMAAGFNTPTIIRFPFENLVRNHKNISMIRLNLDEAVVPQEFGDRAIGINEDIARSVEDVLAFCTFFG